MSILGFFLKNRPSNRMVLFCALIFLGLTGRGQSANHAVSDLVRQWFSSLSRHDTIALANMYADTALIESPNRDGGKRGPAAIGEIYSRYFTTSPDLSHAVLHVFTNDKTAVIEYTSTGTMVNPEKNTPDYMRGKPYTLKNCTRMNIQNGKITAQSTYFDQVAFLRQVGFFDRQ